MLHARDGWAVSSSAVARLIGCIPYGWRGDCGRKISELYDNSARDYQSNALCIGSVDMSWLKALTNFCARLLSRKPETGESTLGCLYLLPSLGVFCYYSHWSKEKPNKTLKEVEGKSLQSVHKKHWACSGSLRDLPTNKRDQ